MKDGTAGSITELDDELINRPLVELWDLIARRMGVCPSFFRLAQDVPPLAWGLFRLAEFAYLDAPMPPLFKETLFTYLSRFCGVRYCVARHCAFLLGRGFVAGDPACPPLSAEQALVLLQEPLPPEAELSTWLHGLAETAAPLSDWPDPASELGHRFRVACAVIFIDPHGRAAWVKELRRLLGSARHERLMHFLTFIRTAHFWTEVHPELTLEPDVEELFRQHEELARLLSNGQEAPGWRLRENERRLSQELSEAKTLQWISSQFISEKQPGALYVQLLEAAMALMRSDAGSVQMLDPSGTYLQLLASRNFAPESEAFWQRVDIGSSSSCGQALKCGTRTVVSDIETSDFIRGTPSLGEYRRSGLRAVQSTPLIARDGRPIGMISTHWRAVHEPTEKDFTFFDVLARQAADLIERTRIEAALRESEQRLRMALAASGMGTWLYRIRSDEQILDENMRRLAGLPPDAPTISLDAFLGIVHDEDRDRLRADFERGMREGAEIDTEFRVRWPDGSLHWLKDRGKAFLDPDGRPLYLTGAAVDITERRQLEEELRDADRRKDEFLAMLGHELRNPLAPLRSAVEILRRQRPDAPAVERERAYALMERQVEHLTRLVDDLLDVSRITRGLVELRKEPVSLTQIADQSVEMATPALDASRHELLLSLSPKPLRVQGDATRLIQVIFNLLNNAAKYTEPGGKIWLSVEREDRQAVVRVRDNGSGIAPELLPRVFNLFTQGERKLDRSQGGLGLGLTLVKRLVEMHGGKVEARSEGPGRGSEFTLRLPALPSEEASPQHVQAPGPQPATAQVDRALVVDDNLDVAEPITWMLEGLAREVKMAHSGQTALDLVGQWRPDIIVCDIGMPGMDGYETCRRLRQLPHMDEVLIAAVSGYGAPEDRAKSQEAGFDRHLVKPIGRAALEELVRSAAARQ